MKTWHSAMCAAAFIALTLSVGYTAGINEQRYQIEDPRDSRDPNVEKITNPDNWIVISQDPCNGYVIYQNKVNPNQNFIYAVIADIDSVTVDDFAEVLTEGWDCKSPQVKKNDTGGRNVQCANRIDMAIWEDRIDEVDSNAHFAVILRNITHAEVQPDLTKLMQTSMLYKENYIRSYRSGACSGEPIKAKAITVGPNISPSADGITIPDLQNSDKGQENPSIDKQ